MESEASLELRSLIDDGPVALTELWYKKGGGFKPPRSTQYRNISIFLEDPNQVRLGTYSDMLHNGNTISSQHPSLSYCVRTRYVERAMIPDRGTQHWVEWLG